MDKNAFMEACRQGGSKIDAALRKLHDDYGHALAYEGRACLGSLEAAQDLAQETLIKVWQRCASFRGDSELFPWIKQILRRAAIDRLRASRPEQPLTADDGEPLAEVEAALQDLRGDAAPTPEKLLHDGQLEACYRRCAQRFAKEQPLAASVIRWVAEDDLTHEQIAVLLDRSPGATREFISQCRKKARVYLHEWYLMAARHGNGVKT
jgi:RNA polymerase sigma-70 factor (ECF subfamily)